VGYVAVTQRIFKASHCSVSNRCSTKRSDSSARKPWRSVTLLTPHISPHSYFALSSASIPCRDGYGWVGALPVSAKREWPNWFQPLEMLARRPDLPRFMPGGLDNPLGARALYLGSTLYPFTARTSRRRSARRFFRLLSHDQRRHYRSLQSRFGGSDSDCQVRGKIPARVAKAELGKDFNDRN
jgi:hypothetical protein